MFYNIAIRHEKKDNESSSVTPNQSSLTMLISTLQTQIE